LGNKPPKVVENPPYVGETTQKNAVQEKEKPPKRGRPPREEMAQ
jgi:hypothetical protein